MQYAKVTTPFSGCRDGSPIVENFKSGDILEGDLAEVAITEEWAEEFDPTQEDITDVAIEDMTLPQLKAFAEAEGIDLGDAKKKSDVLAAVELAQEEGGN